jgi:hypothetical protein
MKQEITSEKKKELELEFKKSMLNVKIFSLMKKQLFSLVMMLALIVIASTSAWAQGSGTLASPLTQITGSTHVFNVSSDAGAHTYTWTLRENTGGTDPATHYSASAAAGAYTVTWTDLAGGVYYIQVVDENGAGCSTTRRFYVTVFTFDVRVAAVNSSAAELANNTEVCGDNNAAAGYIFDNALAGATLAAPDPDGNGSLTNARGTIYSTQWFQLTLTFDGGVTAPSYDNVTFDYVITATNAASASVVSDVYHFNGEAPDGNAAIANGTGSYNVPIMFFDRFNVANDITYSLTVTNFTIRNGATIQGVEKASNEVAYPSASPQQNTSGNVILNAAPGTSTITVTP